MTTSPEEQIRNELVPEERLLWSGQPRGGVRLGWNDVVLIPFSLIVGGFALIAVYAAVVNGVPVSSAPATVLIVLLALYLLVGRFFIDAKSRSKTVYGLTDRRAIIIDGLFRREVESLPLQQMTNIALRERGDGNGTITFRDFSRTYADDAEYTPAFAMIEDARHVHSLILNARANQREVRPCDSSTAL